VAVIGAGGYIGSRVLDALDSRGLPTTGYDRDASRLSDEALNRKIYFKRSAASIGTRELRAYDVVVYLGGYTGRAICERFPQDVEEENVNDIVNLSRRMGNNQMLVFASTSAILEGAGSLPATETWNPKKELLDTYSLSMYRREQALRKYHEMNPHSPRMLGLRFGTVIGISSSQRQEMAYLAFVKSAFTTGVLHVQHPETSRSFLWMSDLTAAILTIIQNSSRAAGFDIFHLSSFKRTIGGAAADVAAVTGAMLRQRTHNQSDIPGFSLDSSSFSKTFNFQFRGTSKTAVQELVLHAPLVTVGRQKLDSPRLISEALVHTCGVCGPTNEVDTMDVLDLGTQPLANDFRNDVKESLRAQRFPLRLILCRSCNHVQLSHIVDRGSLFSNYLYRSGTTATLKDHFKRLAFKIDSRVPKPANRSKTILEIACNDGSQLNQFKALDWQTFGADPAANIVELAREEGHKVKVGFWGVDDFTDILPQELDVILAQNVLAHVPDPVKFLEGCSRHMTQQTLLYIQTSQCDMFESGQFDTTYHEHIHFFTAHSFKRVAELANLHVVDFEIVSIHGRSCLVTFSRKHSGEIAPSYSFSQRLAYERSVGVTTDFYFAKFKYRSNAVQSWVHAQLHEMYLKGFRVIGYGAAAKGIVLLHSLLAQDTQTYTFDFVIDDEPMKQGRFCPGTDIPVKPSSSLRGMKDTSFVVVIFAWNFEAEIKKRIFEALDGSSHTANILIPFPEQRLFTLNLAAATSSLSGRNKYSTRPWPMPFSVSRREVVLYTHLRNEELLAPYWIQHHAPMFDRAYILDYSSTDKSVEIFEKFAPASWVIRRSFNSNFGAHEVDKEVMEEEARCDNCWKIALTTTEFLVHENLRDFLAQEDEKLDGHRYFTIPMLLMVDNSKDKPLDQHTSLISQRSTFASRYGGVQYARYLHNFFPSEYKYGVGRHHIYPVNEDCKTLLLHSAVILKYKLSPWPQVRKRLAQIGDQIPQSEQGLLGTQHTEYFNNPDRAVEDHAALSVALLDLFNPDHCCVNVTAHLPDGYCLSCRVHDTMVEQYKLFTE